ncbi:MAG: hypothetical protein ACTTH7_00625 [Treponema sp.]
MLVTDIIGIEKRNSLIYYREEFSAIAIYNIMGKKQQGKIDFLVEVNPIGEKKLFLELIDTPDYPLLPIRLDVKRALQHLIDTSALPL